MDNIYHIILILQYCWEKAIARSGDMDRDESCIHVFSLVIKCLGITSTLVQNFAI